MTLSSMRLDIPRTLTNMFQSVGVFLDLAASKRYDKPVVDVALKQALSAIKHAAGVIVEGGHIRTICAPDEHLKAIQRKVLYSLQNLPMHEAAHGFVRGRDPLTCASAHTSYWGNQPNSLVILNMDAKNFFPSITSQVVRKGLEANRVRGADVENVISNCMCRADESMALAVVNGLVNLARGNDSIQKMSLKVIHAFTKGSGVEAPAGVIRRLAFGFCHGFLSLGPSVNMINKFLPQGSPTSPLLSNIAFKIVDTRLSAMAASYGGFYTRYADDLTVTWRTPTKGKIIDSMYRCAELVINEYGVSMNRAKKRVMGPGTRQDVVGLCINSGHPTISRKRRMKIKAMAHNEMVRGSKNFHLTELKRRDKFADYTKPCPGERRLAYLMGTVGYVKSVHAREGNRYLNMIRSVSLPSSFRPIELTYEDGIYEDHPGTESRNRIFLPEMDTE